MPFVYLLKCVDGSYYTGSALDLKVRFAQHQAGEGANYTKTRLPVELVFAEYSERVEVAYRREKQIQGWSRAKKEALIERNWDSLPALSRNNQHPSTGSGNDTQHPSTGSGNDTHSPSTGSGSDTHSPSTGSENDTHSPSTGSGSDVTAP